MNYRDDYSQSDYQLVKNYMIIKACEIIYEIPTIEEGRNLVKELTSPNLFFEKVKPLPKDTSGLTIPLIRTIFIDTDTYNDAVKNNEYLGQYLIVLTHEYIHLKELTMCEMYVNYKTFLILYNSNNNYLKQCALTFAVDILWGCYPKEYNCSYYIIEYMKKEISQLKSA